ncbi:NaeI family type II restriction endonuclease [Micromonospora sp. WMMA1949]|uniref:NaeI family type II restriction endonuclease n=1 Tax=Micromonospora sp. WMMA1949 TaxID=3015162 RepID=UPI0022B617B9|nr:NaeI family type II restriction endonuclease [Micromonospora sp. WMMA1949]MCZ7424817.1 NaeI family type II restriction endonuclease [Micromonospora sp. WMMA1949]
MSIVQGELFEDDEVWAALPRTLQVQRSRVLPIRPLTSGRPRMTTGPSSFRTDARPPSPAEDPDIWAVQSVLRSIDPDGVRTGYAIREALDQIYDGQRTGRWDYTQLLKTEKTHVGTLVEIWLQREFRFDDGQDLDYRIAGVEVDCKWSLNLYDWEIPPEMYSRGDKVALLVWANEYTARWASGLIRISEDVLRPLGRQRDGKRRLNVRGRDRILWIHAGADLVKNTLLHITDPRKLELIAYATHGQTAVTNLFREMTGELINRATVLTAAQQVDSAKRVRDARRILRPEGIVIFGHYQPHPRMAAQLHLPVPTLGRFVSTRLHPWQPGDEEPHTEIEGSLWRRARPKDPIVPAPVLPSQGGADG